MEYIVLPHQTSSLIKNLRKIRGLTQKELGERVGLSQKMISVVEEDPRKTSFNRIAQILSELDVELLIRDKKGDDHG